MKVEAKVARSVWLLQLLVCAGAAGAAIQSGDTFWAIGFAVLAFFIALIVLAGLLDGRTGER